MSTPVPEDEDEFTELVGATIPRVDLVDKAANGMTFLIAKSRGGAGLVDPAFVRDLIGKSQPEPAGLTEEQVTMTGTPAAIFSLIHDAAVRQRVSKAGPTNPPACNGNEVSKAMADETTPALDPSVPLAAAEGDAPGDPTTPGSPAWEAIDAATARKWTSILARAQHAIGLLSEREMIEAASADPDDAFAAMDLDDAACAIEYAISVLAPFAVAEQAEADCASDEMAAVGKALGGFDSGPLDTIEALTHVRKAGRVLSSSNEAAIRSAAEQLQKVLASLPAAPTIEDGGQTVAKQEAPVAETATTETPADDVTKAAPQTPAAAEPAAVEPAAPAAPVVKETQTAQVPVYDARGRLVGVTAPENVVPVESPAEEEDAPAEELADEAEAEAAPAAVDLEPAPAAEVGIPADDVAKATTPDSPAAPAAPTDTPTDAESSIADIVKQALDAHSATQEQTIAHLAKSVEELTKKVHTLEEQPAVPGMFSNGAVPSPSQLRGQDAGAPAIDDARARELRKGLYNGPDAPQQHAIANELNGLAIAALADVHARGPQR